MPDRGCMGGDASSLCAQGFLEEVGSGLAQAGLWGWGGGGGDCTGGPTRWMGTARTRVLGTCEDKPGQTGAVNSYLVLESCPWARGSLSPLLRWSHWTLK